METFDAERNASQGDQLSRSRQCVTGATLFSSRTRTCSVAIAAVVDLDR
ncbi:hypothetical protein HSB1_46300 [Halogranum salarium B-1]|uniref:Uncharacterized protein n=1 Tax=Halogranum salarium B-1 TaxID=1210908 RepID=J3JD74_9EURY|nr:hypothetical protein HSB1_46300 [Halogranum salarium B-1]